jgi:hypothetical protein
MRQDFHEVVIERPRGGWRGPRRWRVPTDRIDPEEPAFGGQTSVPRDSASRHRGGTKHLSDLLGPVKRLLHRRVGRPWDRVWSELCGGLDTRRYLDRHVLDHVRRMVDCTECSPNRVGWSRFYVDEQGKLRRAPSLGRAARRAAIEAALLDPR